MSMKYRDANGVETPVAGLNGTSGELVPSVSHYQTGYLNFSNLTNGFEDVTVLDIENQSVQYRVVFGTPMPDTDYVVVVDVHNTNLQVEVASADKTVNGFIVTVRNLVATMRADRGETTDGFTFGLSDNYFNWTAFKLMTDESRAFDEQAIADIQAVVPANATSSNKLVTANEFAETSGSATLASGLSGGITWVKIGRIVQVRVNNVLKSSGAIGAGATLCTGLPRQKNVTSFCIARYPNEANVVDLTGNGELRQTGMYSVATGIGLFGDFTYISAS